MVLASFVQSPAIPIARMMSRNKKRNSTKNICAIAALAAATPVKPKIPAIIEMIKKTTAQYSISISPVVYSDLSLLV